MARKARKPNKRAPSHSAASTSNAISNSENSLEKNLQIELELAGSGSSNPRSNGTVPSAASDDIRSVENAI